MKKFIPFLMSIVLVILTILPSAKVYAANETPPVSIGNAEAYIESINTPVLSAGESNLFKFKIGFHGEGSIQNIKLSVTGDGESANWFQFDSSTGAVTITYIGTEAINTWLRVSPLAKDGGYKLNFNFTYDLITYQKDSAGKLVSSNSVKGSNTDSCVIYVQSKNDNMPFIESAKFNKQQIGKDNKALLTAQLKNPTSTAFRDVRVSLDMQASQGFTLYENFKPVALDGLNAKESKEAIFSIYIASSVVSGNYPLVFNVSYKDSDNTITTIKESIYIEVKRSPEAEGGADGKGNKPRIIVSKYSTDVEEIKAGKVFTLDFTLQNTSTSASVNNIKVVVDSAESAAPSAAGGGASSAVFFPSQGSNSFFIDNIGPKKTVSNKIKLMAKQDIEPGVYPVKIKLEYDSNGVAQSPAEENISFPVSQEQRLDMTGFTPPTEGAMGQPIPINFQYINKGKATIYNFSVNIEGDFTFNSGNVYVGNLSAGYNDFFESSLIPNGEGEQKGVIVLKYEDSQGNPKEQRTEFKVNVLPMNSNSGTIPGGKVDGNIDPITGMPIEQPKTSGAVLWITIGGILLLIGIGIIVFFIIRKKRKAKKELMLDEES